MKTNAWLVATIQSIKQRMEENFLPTNYFILIEKGNKSSQTYQFLPNDLGNTEWIIVVAPYNWENLGYTNTSLKMIGMYNRYFVPTEVIPFKNWFLTHIEFTQHSGQYYNAWQPYPILEHRTKKGLTSKKFDWRKKSGEFNINSMEFLLDAIWTFESEYAKWDDLNKWYGTLIQI